jgi:streptogramin lyase
MPNRKNSFFCTLVALLTLAAVAQAEPVFQEYAVPPGSHPHDVAPSADGGVWYTAQRLGALGHLDPAKTRDTPQFSVLGDRSGAKDRVGGEVGNLLGSGLEK